MSEPKIIVIEGVPVYDYRAFYKKEARAKYISHLDLYRTVQRSFMRAKLPIWFTQGFNPHAYLNFALPIALGYEGVLESFDFRLTENLPEQEIIDRLNGAFPVGISVTAIAPPIKKPAEIERAAYTLTIRSSCPDEELLDKWNRFLSQDTIETEKRTKKGPKKIDLKPQIFEATASLKNGVYLSLTLPAGGTNNINPTLLTDAFAAKENLELDYTDIRRERISCGDGSDFV